MSIRLENTSKMEQSVWDTEDGNKRITIQGGAIETFPDRLAKLFLENPDNNGLVQEFVDAEIPYSDGSDWVWVANYTGHPDALRTIKFSDYSKKERRHITTEEPNPLAEPHTIKFDWDPGQKDMQGPGEVIIKNANLPTQTVRLPPYFRKKMPREILRAWQTCAGIGPGHHFGCPIILSREPRPYEPNLSWSLDEILVFGRLVSSSFVSKNRLKWSRELPKNEKGLPQAMELAAMKDLAYKAYYFLSIDPEVNLPPKSVWEDVMEEFKAKELARKRRELEVENKDLKQRTSKGG